MRREDNESIDYLLTNTFVEDFNLTLIAILLYLDMAWVVTTLNNKVESELDQLPADLRAKFLHIVELLESFGPQNVREPYVKKIKFKDYPLWEIRMKGKSGIGRAIYITASGQRIIVLHAFVKKTQKTPKNALHTVERRLKEEWPL